MIIETCPKCGQDLQNVQICTMPLIRRKECHNCGWAWESTLDQTSRVPFGEPNIEGEKEQILKNFTILLTDSAGKIKDLVTIIDELVDVWDKMGCP